MERTLDGQVAFITGSANGIGRACAFALAERGATVAVIDIDPAGAETAKAIVDRGGTSTYLPTDVSDQTNVESSVAAVLRGFGKIDILVNDAAIFPRHSIADMEIREWKQVIDVNLTGPFICARAAIPGMMSRRQGRVVNVSSGLGMTGGIKAAHYASSKGGLIALTKCLALELAPYGVTANVLVPGLADTEMPRRGQSEAEIQAIIQQIPMRRLAQPGEVAEMLAFIVGPACGYVTGQTILVNGGWIMP